MNIFVVLCILQIVELLKCWRKTKTTYRDDKWLLIKNKNLLILNKRLLFTARPGLKEIHFFVKLLVWLGQNETGGDCWHSRCTRRWTWLPGGQYTLPQRWPRQARQPLRADRPYRWCRHRVREVWHRCKSNK